MLDEWLLSRQSHIEQRLARKHLSQATLVLYDVTSTYFDGRTGRWRDAAIVARHFSRNTMALAHTPDDTFLSTRSRPRCKPAPSNCLASRRDCRQQAQHSPYRNQSEINYLCSQRGVTFGLNTAIGELAPLRMRSVLHSLYCIVGRLLRIPKADSQRLRGRPEQSRHPDFA